MNHASILAFLAILAVPFSAQAATEVDASSAAEGTFDGSIVTATDLLLNRPISTTAGPDLNFPLSGVNDGAASSNGNNGGHDTYFDNGDFGNSTLSGNPVVKIALDTSATGSTSGFTLTSITTINGWQNYDDSFSDQAYSVYFSTVSNPTTFTLLASVNYHPFSNRADGGQTGNTSSLVTLTDLSSAVGVANLEFVLTPSFAPGNTDVQGGSVIREFEATGIPTEASVPEPSTYALMIAGAAGLIFLGRRQRVRL